MPEKKKKRFKLSSLFFEEDGSTEQADSSSGGSPPGARRPTAKTTTMPGTGTADTSGGFDKRIYGSLIKALEKNNQEGFDYFEFKNSLEALKNVIMDEATRFKSAFATASTMDVDLKKLVDSAKFYQTILKAEEEKFVSTLKETSKQKVAVKEKQVKDIENFIKTKSEQIKLLTDEINKLQVDKVKFTNIIADSKIKIEVTKNNFYATFNQILTKIKNDIDKMKNYLG